MQAANYYKASNVANLGPATKAGESIDPCYRGLSKDTTLFFTGSKLGTQ
jgi:hypothetical protein